LTDINPTYATTFSTFSPVRLFVPLGSNIIEGTFTIPGDPNQPAAVSGFGAVFTDVDLPGSSRIEFYNIDDVLVFSRDVLPGTVPDGSLSFLGVFFDAGELITKVRIISGNTALGPNDNPGAGIDIVALDDFLYGEPRSVPEPSALLLAGLGGLGLIGYRWHRRRQSA
jgi:hypothetical protein